jgi:hypothetical protein
MIARLGPAGLGVALAVLAACSPSPGPSKPFLRPDPAILAPPPAPPPPQPILLMGCQALPGLPHAFIGPDVRLRIFCGGEVSIPIASVDEQGPGTTLFSVTLDGDPAFTEPMTSFRACGSDPQVATIVLTPPADAVPGDVYETVATVRAQSGEFPPGTVKVHAEVVAPELEVDPGSIDFGDVPWGAVVSRSLRLVNTSASGDVLISVPGAADVYPLNVIAQLPPAPKIFPFVVEVAAAPAGRYAFASQWKATPFSQLPSLPEACIWKKTITLSANILPPADIADAGADAGDGGADAGADAGDGP